MAETERNRTSQTEILGLNGFEDRAAHQDGYASSRCIRSVSARLCNGLPPNTSGRVTRPPRG